MKVRALKNGELIEVGDRIKTEHMGIGGIAWNSVTRVTLKWAFVRVSDTYEQKFRREYSDFGFRPIPSGSWVTSSYSPWRPIKEETTDA